VGLDGRKPEMEWWDVEVGALMRASDALGAATTGGNFFARLRAIYRV